MYFKKLIFIFYNSFYNDIFIKKMLTKDIFYVVLDYLQFKETYNVLLVCKQFYKWWLRYPCQEVIKTKDEKIVDKYKFFKFSMRYKKLPENMPENLHTLDLSGTKIKIISN